MSASSPPSLDLPQAIERAGEAFARGDFAGAEKLYRLAIAQSPQHAGAWEGLAAALRARGAEAEADAAQKQAGEYAIIAAAKTASSLLRTAMESRAAAIVRKASQLHPDIALGPLALAELLRQTGDLDGALEAARHCFDRDPASVRARQIHSALRGKQPDLETGTAIPAPLLIIDGFLPQALHGQMLDFALAHRQVLKPSVTAGAQQLNWRRSQVDQTPEAGAQVLPLICEAAVAATAGFGLEPFDMASRDIQFTAHNEGDYYKAHRDRAADTMTHRRITFVYYLHRQPRGFEGGGLRLFDSAGNGFVEHSYSKVLPLDNRLVLFPSHIWHEVEPVSCASGLYEDSRFTLNGWLGVAPD
jgi:SM-20-related protein